MARRIRKSPESPHERLVKDLLYLTLVAASLPFTMVEAAACPRRVHYHDRSAQEDIELYALAAGRLPAFLRQHILYFESAIEEALASFARQIPAGARLLDAGSGEGAHAAKFPQARYFGVDLAIGDPRWNYRGLDAIADLAALPFRDGAFAACINIVTLEHVPGASRQCVQERSLANA